METIRNGAVWVAVAMSLVLTGFSNISSADDMKKVKMVVTAAFVSNKGMPVYEEFAKYISTKLGWDAGVVSGVSYTEADRMLDSGMIPIGFVCGLPYVHKYAEGKYELLAVPVMAMKKGQYSDAKGYEDVPGKYYSYVIVHKDSPLKSWEDLKGKTYAFNEKTSNSGYNLPRYRLLAAGAKDWSYFSKVIVSGSHEESIRLVARKTVDASSVDSLVLDYDRSIGDKDALNVKIMEHLGPAGIVPVVISKKADASIKAPLQKLLLNMHKDPEGQAVLKKAMILKFAPPDDKNYDDIRKMEKAAIEAGFKDFQE